MVACVESFKSVDAYQANGIKCSVHSTAKNKFWFIMDKILDSFPMLLVPAQDRCWFMLSRRCWGVRARIPQDSAPSHKQTRMADPRAQLSKTAHIAAFAQCAFIECLRN